MPGPYGVTATGFNPKSLQEIKTDLETAWKVIFGSGADVSADSVDGQIIGVFADRLADLWQLAAALYAGGYPDSASALSLDLVAGITGTVRKAATKTLVDVTFSGIPATNIPAGFRASVTGTGILFETITGPTAIGGGGTVVIEMRAVDTGPRKAPAGTLTTIETPIAGLVSITNASDHKFLGSDVEKDPALRIRRELDLRQIGASAVDAIRAAVLAVPGVIYAKVYENVTDFTEDGIGPHGFEVVVLGGDDDALAQTILDHKPAGTRSWGDSELDAVDSAGITHIINLSRPAPLDAYVTIGVTVNAEAPENIGDLIKGSVVDFGDLNLTVGDPLVSQALVPSVFSAGPGVVDVPLPPKIGTAPAPTLSTTITPTRRQIIDLDTSRVVVNVTRI